VPTVPSPVVSFENEHFFLGHLQSVQGKDAWYYNQRFLGRGGNGTAFLVTCSSGPNLGMQFVLKVFHKISDGTRREAFLKEISHLRSLDHPAITKIFDEGTFKLSDSREYPFAVIEYVPVTARTLIVSQQIDRLRAIRIAFNCLSAITCLHAASPPLAQGVELLDLIKSMLEEKPSNRPPSKVCMRHLNKIHEAYCRSLFDVTGEFV